MEVKPEQLKHQKGSEGRKLSTLYYLLDFNPNLVIAKELYEGKVKISRPSLREARD